MKNNLDIEKASSKIIKSIKKHGWKKTWENLKYNFVMLETPKGMVKKRIMGGVVAICGLIIVTFIFLFRGSWGLSLIMCGTFLIFYSNLKGDLKQLRILKDLEEEFGSDNNVR